MSSAGTGILLRGPLNRSRQLRRDEADEVWFAVQRTVDGVPARYIERFDPNFRTTLEDEDKTNYWYLDCAKRQVFANKTVMIAGLGHGGADGGILGTAPISRRERLT
jgi:hypothetical protein